MLSFIRKQPLPHQLSMGALIAVAFFMTLLIYFISRFFSSEVNNVANDNQIKQVQLVSHNLETRFEVMVENNQTMADMFSAELTGLIRGDWSNLMDVLDSEPGANLSKKMLFKENALLESFTKKSKHLLSIYLKKGNRFINIATSIHDENGKSIVGSKIELGHRAYPRLLNGQNYQAQSQKFGLNLYQNLAPIMINGEVIAVLETSTNLNHIMDKLSDYVKTLSFGHSGYVYVLATGKDEGKLVIHKTLTGRNVYDIQPELTKTFKQAFSLKEGGLTYSMPVEGVDTVARKSKVLFHEVKGWNWVVLLKTYEDEYQAEIDTHILRIELMCLAGTIFLMLVLWLLIRRSLYPLQEITKGLKLLGEGNLTYRFIYQKDEGNKNEMHLLKRDIAAMRDGLLNVIMQVTDSSKDLVGSAESISNVSHELQHHAKKSEAESTHVATAIDQVVVSIAEVANSTRAISIETTAASDISISGNDAVTEVEETVENLSHAFNTASNRIKDVEESSNSIGEVVDVINAIAEQTNLLALNAAIEAARAGEQGRGFAVVADEVRNLAQKTQDSTQKIQSVVEKLQANSQSAVEGMEDGAKEVALSMKKAKTAGILLTQIRESILLVEKSMLDVSCATEEQKLAAQKISNSAKSLTQTSSDTLNHSKFTSDQGQNVKDLSLALLHNISVFKVTE